MEHVLKSSGLEGHLSPDDFPLVTSGQRSAPSQSGTEPVVASSSGVDCSPTSRSSSWRSLFGSCAKLQYFKPRVANGKKTAVYLRRFMIWALLYGKIVLWDNSFILA